MEQQHQHQHCEEDRAGWTATATTGGRGRLFTLRRVLLSLGLATGLGYGAYGVADSYLERRAQQEVADHWSSFRRCFLGQESDATANGQRLRHLALAMASRDDAGAWPARCEPYARSLDAALAKPALAQLGLGPLPPAVAIVQEPDAGRRAALLDQLVNALRDADLPAPRTSHVEVPLPPEPAVPQLAADQLIALGKADLEAIQLLDDPLSGASLRLLLPGDKPLICRLEDGPADRRWRSMSCRQGAASPLGPADRQRLIPAEPGAADLLYYRGREQDGIFDAASGLPIWRPRDPGVQAMVSADGRTTILYSRSISHTSKTRFLSGAGPLLRRYNLVRLAVAEAPSNKRLELPPDAQAQLLPGALLWWSTGPKDETRLYAQPLLYGSEPLGSVQPVGRLPARSRWVAGCTADEGLRAMLFGDDRTPRRYRLVFQERGIVLPPVAAGALAGSVTLGCDAGGATLLRHSAERSEASFRRCRPQAGCSPVRRLQLPPSARLPQAATAVVGDKLLLVWVPQDKGGGPAAGHGGLKLRLARPEHFDQADEDAILLDDVDHGGLELRRLRLLSRNSVTLLLAQDRAQHVYPLRIDAGGAVTPVRIAR